MPPPPTIFSDTFTPTPPFSVSTEFTESAIFTKSDIFSQSDHFYVTLQFSASNKFIETLKFNESDKFSQSETLMIIDRNVNLQENDDDKSLPTGAIAGVAVIGAILVFIIIKIKRRQKFTFEGFDLNETDTNAVSIMSSIY